MVVYEAGGFEVSHEAIPCLGYFSDKAPECAGCLAVKKCQTELGKKVILLEQVLRVLSLEEQNV